jgi:hypothetical protein
LVNSRFASNSWRARPQAVVVRDLQGNWSGVKELGEDAIAAYTQALAWRLTGNDAYARNVIEILNAESATLNSITGHDAKFPWETLMFAGPPGAMPKGLAKP